MTIIEKFRSDAVRTVKRERAENNGRYNAAKACDSIQKLFERNCTVPAEVARAIAFYWRDTYIDGSADFENEPSENSIDKLCGLLSFLNGADEGEEVLKQEDLEEISDAIDDVADTMPIDQLQMLMGKLVDSGTLS